MAHRGDAKERWLEIGTSWFQNPNDWPAIPAADGPDAWQRVKVGVDFERRIGEPDDRSRRVDIVVPRENFTPVAMQPAVVSDVVQGRSSVSFRVDQPGTPILVRTSYFPNWGASGAQGPYRIAPNMMVVVPTENEVSLSFGWSFLDAFAYVLTIAGIVIVVRHKRAQRRAIFANVANVENVAGRGADLDK
jgi:hypothetical protein